LCPRIHARKLRRHHEVRRLELLPERSIFRAIWSGVPINTARPNEE
jgi:hypothetical protein